SVDAIKNERWLRGKSVKEFEAEFAKYVGARHAVAINNGTMALILSIMAMDIGEGDVVITPPLSFIATANSVIFARAKPVFVDIDPKTFNIDVRQLEQEIAKHGGRVKAIMPVHLYGYPAEMDEIMAIAKRHNIKVIEDACQAHGASYKGRMAGSIGDAAAFSFFPSKNMTVFGDGGMVTTNDQTLSETLDCLRDCGRDMKTGNMHLHIRIGHTARMASSHAAIGKVQLESLDKWVGKRRRVAKLYNRMLKGVGDVVTPPKETAEIKPAYHLYVIRTKRRDELKAYLEKNEIECAINFPIPIHLQPPYRAMGYKEGMYPHAEAAANEVLSLPMHQNLKKDDVEYVVNTIKRFFEERA
ncbi:MAG: DegT/DnrJ/EryC1/StrS family aminotransferase, partial [Candidatus Micrarchaeota archaeon]|nr:DegT/DnrJ/EryC1/StrS family aminotransferase [Candidatus Micrarchaeota archaeon]